MNFQETPGKIGRVGMSASVKRLYSTTKMADAFYNM
jgi:hypothetical protein